MPARAHVGGHSTDTRTQVLLMLIERAGSKKTIFGSLSALVVDTLVIMDDPLLSQLEVMLIEKALFDRFTYLAGHLYSDVQGAARASSLDFIEFSRMLQHLGLIEGEKTPTSSAKPLAAAVLKQKQQRISKEQAAAFFCLAMTKATKSKMSISGELDYKTFCMAARQVFA